VARILVIDDEPDVALGLRLLLERAGHTVAMAEDGRDGLRSFYADTADLVVLDVSMPVMDGWTTLERLREVSDVPVLMLTARDLVQEKVRGLQGGADDYMTKPFSNQELLARVDAMLRRRRPEREAVSSVFMDDQVTLDAQHWRVMVGGHEVKLTPLEFRLLRAFVRHPNQVLSHAQLLELAWGNAGAASRDEIKTYVRYLRRKLGWGTGATGPIQSVRGVGYRYRSRSADTGDLPDAA
jgi:DNA-binding response OmpR family regulator